jgi:hypothetical protein
MKRKVSMDIILFLIVLHVILYAPYFIPKEEVHIQPVDTVSQPSVNKGVPYFHMGKFVRLLEI